MSRDLIDFLAAVFLEAAVMYDKLANIVHVNVRHSLF